jgi:hypothetical protein
MATGLKCGLSTCTMANCHSMVAFFEGQEISRAPLELAGNNRGNIVPTAACNFDLRKHFVQAVRGCSMESPLDEQNKKPHHGYECYQC